ncbi:MAG: DUF1902 domain-containing protein [Anaerocolumna sp.]
MTGDEVIKIIEDLNEIERNKVIVHLQRYTKPVGFCVGENYSFWLNPEDNIYDESYIIKLLWDSEAGVWVATSEDVKGLVLESDSIEALIEKVKLTVPELLSLNRVTLQKPISLYFNIIYER